MKNVLDPTRKLSFESALLSTGRSPEIPESEDTYGWLVGSWELKVLNYWVDVRDRGIGGEVHANWVLEGRAVQDVWIMPPLAERTQELDKVANMFGTTLRVWDPSIRAWRITWINPVTAQQEQQIGRRMGDEIVQIGCHANGVPSKWRFTEITRDSFHWIGEFLEPDGRTWKTAGEFLAARLLH